MGTPFETIIDVICIIFGLWLYFLPSILAYRKKHKNRLPILLINIFLGATAVGWLAAFIWCFIQPKETTTGNAEEISKLFELKEKGVISQEEFERKKKELLA